MIGLMGRFALVAMYVAKLNGYPEPIGAGIALGSIVFARYITLLTRDGK
jgi:hypothetical protein